VLKLSLRHLSEAEELEKLVNELCTQEDSAETTYHSILQLLVELKNFQINKRVVLVLIYSQFFQLIINFFCIFNTFVDENVIFVPCRMYFIMVETILPCLRMSHRQKAYQCSKHILWNLLSCQRSLKPCWVFARPTLSRIPRLILSIEYPSKINMYLEPY